MPRYLFQHFALADIEPPVRAFFALFVYDNSFRLSLEEKALVCAAPVQRPAVLAEASHFVNDILAIAFDVAVDNQRTSCHPVSNCRRLEELPLLASVKIAVDPRQVPGQRPVYLRMEQQRRRHR